MLKFGRRPIINALFPIHKSSFSVHLLYLIQVQYDDVQKKCAGQSYYKDIVIFAKVRDTKLWLSNFIHGKSRGFFSLSGAPSPHPFSEKYVKIETGISLPECILFLALFLHTPHSLFIYLKNVCIKDLIIINCWKHFLVLLPIHWIITKLFVLPAVLLYNSAFHIQTFLEISFRKRINSKLHLSDEKQIPYSSFGSSGSQKATPWSSILNDLW